MHTIPAAKVVGHDFLGNHIGELLFRQPIKKSAPPSTTKTSSTASTVGTRNTSTVRRSSCSSQSMALSSSTSSNARSSSTSPLDSSPGVDALTPLGTSADPIASLENSSESSISEPSSVDGRNGSRDPDMLLHLDQLPVSHKRLTSDGGLMSPRVSFYTSFGAKLRRSGSRHAPSEAGSSGYFGMSTSNMSSASMSPMEYPGGISWNYPFNGQHQSFAMADQHNTTLNRNPSQQLSGGSSPSPSSSMHQSSAGAEMPHQNGHTTTKSQSFSGTGTAQPALQRLNRAATESALPPIPQSQSLKSPGASSGLTVSSMSHSNSMGSSAAMSHGHRRKPSLVPKGDDERTFCFIEPEFDSDSALVEEPENVDGTLTSVPSVAADPGQGSDSVQGDPAKPTTALEPSPELATPLSTVHEKQRDTHQSDASRVLNPVASNQDTPAVSLFPVKPLQPLAPNGSYRPARKLRIQPNVQSRRSLLELTMEQQERSSREAQSAKANGVSRDTTAATNTATATAEAAAKAPSVTSRASGGDGDDKDDGERYKRIAYGPDQRIFRIHSKVATPTNEFDYPFIAGTNAKDAKHSIPQANHARTSNWARAQNLLAEEHDLSQSVLLNGTGCYDRAPPPPTLHHYHTTSHSSTSTTSPSLLDNRELLSPPETAISTPELEESPPLKPERRSSPLGS